MIAIVCAEVCILCSLVCFWIAAGPFLTVEVEYVHIVNVEFCRTKEIWLRHLVRSKPKHPSPLVHLYFEWKNFAWKSRAHDSDLWESTGSTLPSHTADFCFIFRFFFGQRTADFIFSTAQMIREGCILAKQEYVQLSNKVSKMIDISNVNDTLL